MNPSTFRFLDCELNATERRLLRSGRPLPLRGRGFDLLLALLHRGGRLVTKDDLYREVWPGLVVEEANIHTQVSQLRKLLGAEVIATVSGLGYRLACPLESDAQGDRPPAIELPAERTPFVGREAALEEASRNLAGTRLLTLVGIGGSGKTRLALRLAARAGQDMPDGAAWVDLAASDDAAAVEAALSASLGCREPQVGMSVSSQLCKHLRPRRMLLVLDNCEHLLDAVARIVDELLSGAPGLKVLATSREPLGLPNESLLAVRPMDLPLSGATPEQVLASESVQLMLDRAMAAVPTRSWNETADVQVLAEICRRVDGIPLAIELAAARLRVVSPTQLLNLLHERFRVLVGPRRALARQQTLHAVLAWSHAQLTGWEQRVLAALSICRGGCDADSLRAIVDARDVDTASLHSALSRLIELTLVSVPHASGDVARYGVLETVRQFTAEQAQDAAIAAEMRNRHAAHFLDLAEAHDQALLGRGHDRVGSERLTREHHNLLQALGWLLEEAPASAGATPERVDRCLLQALRLVAALRHHWWYRGRIRQGLAATQVVVQRWAQRVESRAGAAKPDRAHLWALAFLVQGHRFVGEDGAALGWARQLLAAAEAVNDDEILSIVQGLLGTLAAAAGRAADARSHLEAGLAAAQRTGLAVRIGDLEHGLAQLDADEGRLGPARSRMAEVIVLRRDQRHLFKLAWALLAAARLDVDAQDARSAWDRLLEAARLLPDLGDVRLQLALVDIAGACCAIEGRHDLDALLLGAFTRHHLGTDFAESASDTAWREQRLDRACLVLGDGAASAAFQRGETQELATVLDEALSAIQPRKHGHPASEGGPARWSGPGYM